MASPRYPPIPPTSIQSTEQRRAHDSAAAHTDAAFSQAGFTYKVQDDGTLLGPFALFLRTPAAMNSVLDLTKAVGKMTGITPAVREIIILTVASHFQCKYVVYCHSRASLTPTVALTPEHVKAFATGRCPDDAEEWERMTYDVSKQLFTVPGPLAKSYYERAVETFGQDGTLTLIQFTGIYAWMSILMNGADTQVPEGEELLPKFE